MIGNMLTVPRLAAVAALALVAAAAGAVAQASRGVTPAPPPRPAPAPQVAPPMLLGPQSLPVRPALRCAPSARGHKIERKPPSEALKRAFGILRRERRDSDALPAQALRALKAAGLEPVDAQAARLLRADGAARAWAVPAPHVDTDPFRCLGGPAATPAREGLAVVALGGAPAGGGGALSDLRRGLAPAAVDPCAGADRNMIGVSGIVPDGVEAVFVTAADGSATRADVRDNGYAFVLPRPRRPEARYLVWTASDGTPHVQPLPPLFVGWRAGRCPEPGVPPRVTPGPFDAGCAAAGSLPLVVSPRPRRPPRRTAPLPRRPHRVPRRARPALPFAPPPAPLAACIPQPPLVVSPRMGPVLRAPVPRRAPSRPAPARRGP